MFSSFLSDCLVSEEWSWTQRMALTGGEGDELVREWIDHFPSDWQTYRISFQVLHGGFRNVGFPGGSDSKESACNVGDPGLIPGLGRSSGEGNGEPVQYSCLENSMDRAGWWTSVHGIANRQTQLKWLAVSLAYILHIYVYTLYTYICIYVSESLCCTPGTTLKINYTSLQKKLRLSHILVSHLNLMGLLLLFVFRLHTA